MDIEVGFPGGVAVDSGANGLRIRYGHPPPQGGGKAHSQFELLFA